MAILNLLKSKPSSAAFVFHHVGRQASQLAVDADRQLSIRLMDGDSITTEIPLGQASAENLRLLRERLRQIEELIRYLP